VGNFKIGASRTVGPPFRLLWSTVVNPLRSLEWHLSIREWALYSPSFYALSLEF
jgi:hypothetical protein